jgi:hypothetical protein
MCCIMTDMREMASSPSRKQRNWRPAGVIAGAVAVLGMGSAYVADQREEIQRSHAEVGTISQFIGVDNHRLVVGQPELASDARVYTMPRMDARYIQTGGGHIVGCIQAPDELLEDLKGDWVYCATQQAEEGAADTDDSGWWIRADDVQGLKTRQVGAPKIGSQVGVVMTRPES